MKRFRLAILLVLVASISGLVIGYSKTRILQGSADANLQIAGQEPLQTQPQPISVGSFVAQGMPIQFTEVAAVSDKGSSDLSYTLVNSGNTQINGLDLAILDFNPAGRLMGVQSWGLQPNIVAGARQSFSLKLRHRVTPGDRLVLCAEAVRGDAGAWQVGFNDLAQAVAASIAGGNAPPPEVKQIAEKLPESFGGAYCSDAFIRAFRLAKTGDGKGLSSFTCDRDQRLSVFKFSAKNLVK